MTYTRKHLGSLSSPAACRWRSASDLPDAEISESASRPFPMILALRASSSFRRPRLELRRSSSTLPAAGAGSPEKISSGLGNGARCTLISAAFDGRQMLPDLVGGKGEDRRDQAHQRFGDLPEHGLRGAARLARGREGVHAVLEHVEIKGAQVHDGELFTAW